VTSREGSEPTGRPSDAPAADELADLSLAGRAADLGDGAARPDGDDGDGGDEAAPRTGRDAAWVPPAQRWRRLVERLRERVDEDPGVVAEVLFSLLAVGIATWVVAATVDPWLVLRDTTPTGGDMGAHVWGPNYLRHHVLPNLRLTGWTHDWFNGFPAYQFYMVIPSLLIVALSVGLTPLLAVPVALLALAGAVAAWLHPRLFRFRRPITVGALVLAVLVLPVAYNVSFKVVTVLGLVCLPVASWAMAKLADLPFPIPPLAAVASLLFLYNREPLYLGHGNIIGGNISSTMAGEFAFSISLTIAVLYLGVASRGLRTGRYRALSAVLFALAGLCHLIPAFFVLACTAALFLLHPDRARLRWLSTMTPVAGLLTAFWVLPFWWRRHYVNDMGWERLPEVGAELSKDAQTMAGDQSSVWYYLWPPSGLRWIMVAALVGVVVSLIRRYRVGMVLSLAWLGVDVAFVLLPQYRLWNARLLPFMYLVVALLAAIGVGELIRVAGVVASGRVRRPFRPITVAAAAAFSLGALVAVIIPVDGLFESRSTRFGFERADEPVERVVDGQVTTVTEHWSRFKLFGFTLYEAKPERSSVAGWARWNYTGLEDEDSKAPTCSTDSEGVETCTGGWPEYRDFIATMDRIGKDPDHGCGRLLWEFSKDRINSYGTTMAPMLLPYWTDGCIASQEGLYFESTPSVPFHFMVQSELSTEGSRPQRFVNWPDFDLDRGVRHLQLLGVRYYAAITEQAIAAADRHPDLTPIAQSPAWHIYEVADAPEVSALDYEPVVVEGLGESQDDWLPIASSWFQQGDLDVLYALDGPDGWERVQADPVPTDLRRLTDWLLDQVGQYRFLDELPEAPRTRLPENTVSNIRLTEDEISFDVSRPGVPVLVKTSYFPNWTASGAGRIYRVAPNLMVVVPTDTHVSLRYGRTPPDVIAQLLTLAGLVGLWWLARQRPIDVSELRAGALSDAIDRALTIAPGAPPRPGVEPAWPPPPPPSESPWAVPPPAPASTEPDAAAGDPTATPAEADLWWTGSTVDPAVTPAEEGGPVPGDPDDEDGPVAPGGAPP